MSKLTSINQEIKDCPVNDSAKYEDLMTERDNISQEILQVAKAHAINNADYTMNDVGTALLWEAGCGLLLLAPTP